MNETQTVHKIQPYQRLAAYYDRLMDFIDYDIWVEDIEELIASFEPGSKWLDISCGTGSMAIRLAKRGYDVTAVDLSQAMIDIASAKATAAQTEITFNTGDMTSYSDGYQYDVIVNLHDGLNYLLNTTDIRLFMENTFSLLKPGGILVFDVVTPLLCQTHFRGYREIFSDEMGGYERDTSYDPVSQLAKSVFTLNTEFENTVEVETHIQKAYELEDVDRICLDSQYQWWQILDDETLEKAGQDSERFLVMLRKSL